MRVNEGRVERAVRSVLGAAGVILGLALPVGLAARVVLVAVGVVLLVTGTSGYCPVYHLAGRKPTQAGK